MKKVASKSTARSAPKASAKPNSGRTGRFGTWGVPVINANILRALAEEADGHRDANVLVVPDPDNVDRPYKVVVDNHDNRLASILAIRTDNNPKFAKREFKLVPVPDVQFTDVKHAKFEHCDAIFLSAAAVDKFVVPYYARMRRLDEVQRSRNAFAEDATKLAVVHLPESVDDTISAPGSLFMVEELGETMRATGTHKLVSFLDAGKK